jgi:hypothetical protein
VQKVGIPGVYTKKIYRKKRMELKEQYWKEVIIEKFKRSARKKRNPFM